MLQVLAARAVEVPEQIRRQFLACTDSAQLDTWLDRASTAGTSSDVTGPRGRRRWPRLRRPSQ